MSIENPTVNLTCNENWNVAILSGTLHVVNATINGTDVSAHESADIANVLTKTIADTIEEVSEADVVVTDSTAEVPAQDAPGASALDGTLVDEEGLERPALVIEEELASSAGEAGVIGE